MQDYYLSHGKLRGKRTLVYLASPFTATRKAVEKERTRIVTLVSGLMAKRKIPHFSPIVQSSAQREVIELPGDYSFWQTIDEQFLLRSDELWVLCIDGWKTSIGVTAEIEFAENIPITVRYIEYDEKYDEITFIDQEAINES